MVAENSPSQGPHPLAIVIPLTKLRPAARTGRSPASARRAGNRPR